LWLCHSVCIPKKTGGVYFLTKAGFLKIIFLNCAGKGTLGYLQ
jgi:hypothetical protein